jgi:SH3-like domain-containing protein
MKLNVWIVAALAPLTSVMLLAQDTAPAPATGAPAPAPETAPAAPKKKASSVKKRVVLDPPAPATVKSAGVNVRGRASFKGETLGHVQKGDTVTVLEQITLSRTAKDEPAEWAQIAMPAGIPVWVNGDYIDSDAKTIKARRVNLRGGPGENYSVVGRLEKGAAIKQIKTDGSWVAIEAPTNAYAFVAAEFLDMQPAPAVAVTPPPATPAPASEPQVVNVNTPAAPAVATPEAPVPGPQSSETERELEALHHATAAPAPAPAQTPPPALPPAPAATPAASAANEPLGPRIVTREGFVRRAYNIQSPTDFELHDIQSGKLIDYLQPKPGQNFKIFIGTRVTVTGPEGMDPRWTRTPVLQVQSVDLMP